MQTEAEYIEERRRHAESLSHLFLKMQKYPLEPQKIAVAAFEGEGRYGCNPRYIVEELHRRNPDLYFVWLMNDTDHEFPDWIEKVEDTPENTAYHLSTATVWIDNYRKPWGTMKRPGQLYIQTWHGTLGIKAVGNFRGDRLPKIARIVSEADSKLIDYVIVNSAHRIKLIPDLLFYDGSVLRLGTPRNDIVVSQREKFHHIIHERYNIDPEKQIILFAPTFRGGNQQTKKQVTKDYPKLNFKRLTTELSASMGGKWQVMLRLHPQVSAKMQVMTEVQSGIVDASQADDISELIAGADALLTDYSSCAFDAAYAYMPVFLYADDVAEYVANRGKFMWQHGELPFSTSQTEYQLWEAIHSFDEKAYKESLQAFFNRIDLLEDGHASARVANLILEFLNVT